MANLSRRGFLKFAGVTVASPFFDPDQPDPVGSSRLFKLGRVTDRVTWAYTDTKPDAAKVKSFPRDTVLKIYD